MAAVLSNYSLFSSDSKEFSQFRGCSELLPLSPTPIFEAFWAFAAERQAIFFRRQTQTVPPWTSDPILATFKFTNVYRASDRVSQYLIRNVIYQGDQKPTEVLFRILLFKLFNKIETWELLTKQFGEIRRAIFSVSRFDQILSAAFERGQRIYSAAYIMPSGSRTFSTSRKHLAHLQLLELILKSDLQNKIVESRSLGDVFRILRSYPMIGDFLAYQYAIDINYSKVTDFSESQFVMAGPGARSGIERCFMKLRGTTHDDVIRLVTEYQDVEFEKRNLAFARIGNRPLQLIDVQNLFCEIDKYARARFPNTNGSSTRSRIKQRFRPNLTPIEYWYPPKWRIPELRA